MYKSWNSDCWSRRLLRLLANQEWMPTIESVYVIQRLEFNRDQAWQNYESERYGPTQGKTQLEAYFTRVQQANARDNRPLHAPPPPELDPPREKRLRLRWLQMTEALAECYSFSDPPVPALPDARQPQFLQAAELLAHAGELQHEIICDLRRCAATFKEEPRRWWDQKVAEETQSAIRFFDLSTRCIELWLDPEWVPPVANNAQTDRWEYFCGPPFIADRRSRNISSSTHVAPDERRWCITLAHRYRLLESLESRLGEGSKQEALERPYALLQTLLPKLARTEGNGDAESLLAECACDAAQVSLWLELRQGDPSTMLWLMNNNRPEDKRWEDVLATVDMRLAHIARLAEECGEFPYRAIEAVNRVIHLRGLAIEQDLDYLHSDRDVWYERCELAANLYSYEKSLRTRRLCALVNAILAER